MPPTWVPLAEVGVWIKKVYRPTNLAKLFLDFKLLLRSRPQHARLHYRLGPFLTKDVKRLPRGLKVAFHEGQRIGVVSSWDAAGADFEAGTVDGWPGENRERRTLPMEVLWADVER